MKLQIQVEGDVLKVVATGRFSLGEAKRIFVEMLEAAAAHGAAKVHLDGREIVGNPRTIERFLYGEYAALTVADYGKRGVAPSTPFAYVLRSPVLDPERFGETVAVNRGMNIRVFGDFEQSLRWIGVAPAEKLQADDGRRGT